MYVVSLYYVLELIEFNELTTARAYGKLGQFQVNACKVKDMNLMFSASLKPVNTNLHQLTHIVSFYHKNCDHHLEQ